MRMDMSIYLLQCMSSSFFLIPSFPSFRTERSLYRTTPPPIPLTPLGFAMSLHSPFSVLQESQIFQLELLIPHTLTVYGNIRHSSIQIDAVSPMVQQALAPHGSIFLPTDYALSLKWKGYHAELVLHGVLD